MKMRVTIQTSIRPFLGPHPAGCLESRQCKIVPYNFVADNSLFLIHSSACSMGPGKAKYHEHLIGFDFDLNSPFNSAEEGVLAVEAFCEDVLTVTAQKAVRSNYKANLSAAATARATDEGICMLFMQTELTGRHSFGYFSYAVVRKVTRHEGETDGRKVLAIRMKNKLALFYKQSESDEEKS